MQITQDTIIKRLDQDVAETELDGNIVLLHIENGKYYNFNQVSSDLWTMLQEPIAISQLTHNIHQKYDCTTEQCQADIIDFIYDLLEQKLLTIIN